MWRTPAPTAPFPTADDLGQTGESLLDGSVRDRDVTDQQDCPAQPQLITSRPLDKCAPDRS